MKKLLTIIALFWVITSGAVERQYLWPKGKMPDNQPQQIAALGETIDAADWDPDKNRLPYLEWFEAPDHPNGACMLLISGGAYNFCCDDDLIKYWNKKLTAEGVQCVNLVYRTPRPEGLPIYQSAWEDGQRAIKLIRSQAKKRNIDPERIGAVGMSAGAHLALLLAFNSQTPAYEKIDAKDTVSCHINWAIANAPAYSTTDGETGTESIRQGYGPDVKVSGVFKFDEKTCPVSFHHGGKDPYSPNGSTLMYRELRKKGIPAELHIYPGKGHGAYGFDRAIEFMRQMEFLGTLESEQNIMNRYVSDDARAHYFREDVWPEGKTPYFRENQCVPYIEWHIPAELKTKAVQIIYSGGAYNHNDPDGFEVAPVRRFLNDKGMAVVTLKYRTPRPEGLPKHMTAWQDLQRTIRIVRSEAAERGLDPDRIGIMGSSAGGHLTLMGVTSSKHQSYLPIDKIDKQSCKVQWGIGIYPAYVLTDGLDGGNENKGNKDSNILSPEFSFDLDTAPMLFLHGDNDVYSPMGSVKVWEKMRAMGIQSELHTLALRNHCFQRSAASGTGSYNWIDRIWEFLNTKKFVVE